jgi:hypothetical protein
MMNQLFEVTIFGLNAEIRPAACRGHVPYLAVAEPTLNASARTIGVTYFALCFVSTPYLLLT